MIKYKAILTLFLSLLSVNAAFSAEPAPAVISGLTAVDMPYDVGNAVMLRWAINPSDTPDTVYVVHASSQQAGAWVEADRFSASAKTGDDIGVKTPDHARQHDKVFLVTP